VAEGSLTDITIYPRRVVEEVLKHHASFAILAHNHPSGLINPSQNDLDATFVINRALTPLDVTLLDHIVIGGEDAYSFSERGKMDSLY
jgi:DNA repair protein RadC